MFRSLNSRLLLSYVAVTVVCLVLVGLGLLLFAGSLWTRETFWRLEAAAQATLLALRRPARWRPSRRSSCGRRC